MKIYTPQFLFILLLLASGPVEANRFFNSPGNVEEKVVFFTDRNIYIAGEQIQFSASLFTNNGTDALVQSRILYCELITPDGKIISNNKYICTNSIAGGCVTIPDDLITGIYYVRAYTKLMRTYGPESYEYKQIRIINPLRNEVLKSENKTNLPAQQFIQVKLEQPDDFLSVSVDKAVYTSRDTISLSYKQVNGSIVRIKGMCVSVIPENAKSTFYLKPAAEKPLRVSSEYYPETRGLSLVGKLTEATSSTPIIDKKVNLSIIGEGRDFIAARTDTNGRFFFALPDYYGARDLFLCAEKTPSTTVKIWIDNDFCTTPFRLPSPLFSLTDQEREAVKIMAQNMQINMRFRNDSIKDSLNPTGRMSAFYGMPTNTIVLDKYIQLPTLEEYFNELPSQVKVRKRKGEPYFSIQNSGATIFSLYDPLVLVDWVAVDEPAKILAASPQSISRIEVINEDYVKGGQSYGGIISFISKKGDFAGIDLPSAGLFIKYRFLANNQCTENFTDIAAYQPDVRNTVLWKPALKIPVSQPENIIFTAPDTPGKYSIVLEGVTTEGEIFTATSTFEVNN